MEALIEASEAGTQWRQGDEAGAGAESLSVAEDGRRPARTRRRRHRLGQERRVRMAEEERRK
jgi:hypothetical protein